MHVSNTINPALLSHFFKMVADGAIMESDVKEFCDNPRLWRARVATAAAASAAILTPDSAQAFWQSVWDELLGKGKVTVPAVPTLTPKQVKSLERFGFMLMYLPAITEDQYPKGFVKPDWGKYLKAADIERRPLMGAWVAIETIAKPHWDDKAGYPNDRLTAAMKLDCRFGHTWDAIHEMILSKAAKVTVFPKKGTRLPTAEEWNLAGNLFNWLTAHRSMNLPDLGSTRSWEWCDNACESEYRLLVGDSEHGGLASVGRGWCGGAGGIYGFRVLAVL